MGHDERLLKGALEGRPGASFVSGPRAWLPGRIDYRRPRWVATVKLYADEYGTGETPNLLHFAARLDRRVPWLAVRASHFEAFKRWLLKIVGREPDEPPRIVPLGSPRWPALTSGFGSSKAHAALRVLWPMLPSLQVAGSGLELFAYPNASLDRLLPTFLDGCETITDDVLALASALGPPASPEPGVCHACDHFVENGHRVCSTCHALHHGKCYQVVGCSVWTCPEGKGPFWGLRDALS